MNGDVTLTLAEIEMAANVGVRRQAHALIDNRPDAYGAEKAKGWQIHLEGACGELAVAKYRGVYWDGSVNTFKHGADVMNLHVRTRREHDFALLIRDDDPDDGVFVLVTGRCPHYRVHGWIRARHAKRAEYLKDYAK